MTETQRNEALVERGQIINRMRTMVSTAEAANRDFDSTEQETYNNLETQQKAIKARVDRDIALATQEAEHAAIGNRAVRTELEMGGRSTDPRASAEYAKNFQIWMRHGTGNTPLHVMNSLTKATGTQVGYLVPTEYETTIRKKVYDINIMRQICSVLTSTSDHVIPLEGTLPTFTWIDELGTFGQTDLTVGRGSFSAYKLGGILKASTELIDDAFTSIPDYIGDRSKVALALTEETAFISGDGNKKPTGVAVGTTVGLTTAATTVTTGDELISFLYSLTRPYRANATLLTSDAFVLGIRKLKDSTGQYLWQPGLQGGQPDRVLSYPVRTSPAFPVPVAAGVSAIFGDFSYYQIIDRQGFYLNRLNELYAESGQIGFQIWERLDGKTLNPSAFVALAQHA